jgi:hypothetical protein
VEEISLFPACVPLCFNFVGGIGFCQ